MIEFFRENPEMLNYVWMVLLAIVSYLFGSISFARILAKVKGVDITNQGSGNPGTMNMLRTFGLFLGGLTFVLDILKGFLPALCGMILFNNIFPEWSAVAMYTAGLCSMLGHLFPIYYKFKGGKGVATTMGVFFCATPIIATLATLAGIIYIYFREYGGIGSLIMICSCSIYEIIYYSAFDKVYTKFKLAYLLVVLFLFMFISIMKHRGNLRRVVEGTERKTSLRKMFKEKLKNRKERKNLLKEENKSQTTEGEMEENCQDNLKNEEK